MKIKKTKWQVINKDGKKNLTSKDIVKILLRNRGIKTAQQEKEFLNPSDPAKITLRKLKISEAQVKKTIARLKQAYKNKEKVIVYGDYDADGICGTAVLWESLYSLGFDVWPYIPERFSEGYGVNADSVKKLKNKNPELKLIITVDNGIVANKEIEKINKLGIDVIVTDHHQKEKKRLKAFSIVHTTEICGSAIAWILAKEINKKFKKQKPKFKIEDSLDLVAIGTIADLVPLTGVNRSFVKWGIKKLNETRRPGLLAMFREASLEIGEIGTYEVGFIIAPRINATGRIEHGIESLRILCTKSVKRAQILAQKIGSVNQERQRIVNKVVLHSKSMIGKDFSRKVIILAHEIYHEGVIGLAASKLVEKFHRPSIVISKGKKVSKASARSISGFNIIKNIRELKDLIKDGGGHPMAAGFSISTSNIEAFSKRFEEISDSILTEELLAKKIKIDMELDFNVLNLELIDEINRLQPFGIGNPFPIFVSRDVEVVNARIVGRTRKHLKMTLRKNSKMFDAIAFNQAEANSELELGNKIDIAYSIDKDLWDGREKLQIKIRDIRS